MPSGLPAKSARAGRPPVTLKEHLRDTERVVVRMFDPERRWGQRWLEFFGIGLERADEYIRALRVAALFHDIGKANEDFVAAVTTGGQKQTLRHEHLSALILHLAPMRSWLAACADLDLDAVTAAVLSHHLKAAAAGDHRWGQPATLRSSVALYLDHPDVAASLERVAAVLGLGRAPALPASHWTVGGDWEIAQAAGLLAAAELRWKLRRDDARRRFVAALKAGLIVADAVSSGLVREGHDIRSWLEDVVHATPLTGAALREAIIEPRVRAHGRRNARPFQWHAFQQGAALLGPRALLLAACGSGKTLAAWRWAEAQLTARPAGRVIFLYPTRGTATEGFREYVGWAPESEAALVHGTARYELEGMSENPPESVSGKSLGSSEAEARLFALGLWSRRYFSATVDQFLAFLETSYASVCLLPALADSVVIIDEVHSFDERMFDSLSTFLRTFDVPVLCMTATLPPGRRARLEGCGLASYPAPADRVALGDLERLECHPRYSLEHVADEGEALQRATDAWRAGYRVLWVVNVVARAQRIARRLEALLCTQVLCYHSRFRLIDRRRAHAETVSAFQQLGAPRIAVTTQVCEMSLDLDADVLVSELAPVPALVQRLGRANRHLARGATFRATAHVYSPPATAPYERSALDAARRMLDELNGHDVSQRDLACALERFSVREPEHAEASRFLDGGYFATPGSFRDGDDFGTPVVLDADLVEVESAIDAGQLDGHVLTVPHRFVLHDSPRLERLPRHIGLASARFYDPRFGFETTLGVC
jgi:CRISPR-associated endonuclease/helicase Cas3